MPGEVAAEVDGFETNRIKARLTSVDSAGFVLSELLHMIQLKTSYSHAASEMADLPKFPGTELSLKFASREIVRDALIRIPALRPTLSCESLASWQDVSVVPQHRKLHRVPFSMQVEMFSFHAETKQFGPELILGRSRDISPAGVCITCLVPIETRHVALRFPESGTDALFIVDFRWCRFTRERVYLCGGNFVGVADE